LPLAWGVGLSALKISDMPDKSVQTHPHGELIDRCISPAADAKSMRHTGSR